MQEDNEFRGIGKNTPYKVPDSFFEMISERTLRKSKVREQKRRKSLVLWRTMAVAATLATLVSLTYFMAIPGDKPESNMISANKQPVGQQITRQKQEISKQPENHEMKASTDKRPSKTDAEENSAENVGDVLAELSDEELAQLETMYKTDPFINESAQ